MSSKYIYFKKHSRYSEHPSKPEERKFQGFLARRRWADATTAVFNKLPKNFAILHQGQGFLVAHPTKERGEAARAVVVVVTAMEMQEEVVEAQQKLPWWTS